MSDLLGQPALMNDIGRAFASAFGSRPIDVVMTVETKGIPLAYTTAAHLNLPVVIVRRDPKVTEGSSVSINYVSGSNKRIHTMTLARRALKSRSNVLIVDDFMRAGGTVRGMMDLLQEFDAKVQGVGVLVEAGDVNQDELLVHEYISLAKLTHVDAKTREIRLIQGNYFEEETKQ
jgi:purine operon repressor